MVDKNQIAKTLIQMIDRVAKASVLVEARVELLNTLNQLFDFDQAAICQLEDSEFKIGFAIDRTKRILTNSGEVWLSQTVLNRALQSKTPTYETAKLIAENGVSKSISEHRVKGIVCIPLETEPVQILYMASQRNPMKEYSNEELLEFKIAADAAFVALNHHQSNQSLKKKTEELEKISKEKKRHLIYQSPEMEKCVAQAHKMAPFNISLFIRGESGVGKEELAREIHEKSNRTGQFLAVNCANFSETLLESELFGYVKGAFTGALGNKKGLFQEADGGTFFFDEIAEMPLNLQSKLLRVLQERKVRPLGANSDIEIDVRFLSASHVNLEEAVRKKTFRQDLFYRLQEFTIEVPPLRNRKRDIELLAIHFTRSFSREFGLNVTSIDDSALEMLRDHFWVGNVRELKNVIRAAVITSNEKSISPNCIKLSSSGIRNGETSTLAESNSPGNDSPTVNQALNLKDMTKKFEVDLIKNTLKHSANQAEAADRLGISVRTLQRILNSEDSDAESAKY